MRILFVALLISCHMGYAQDRFCVEAGMNKTWSYKPGIGSWNPPYESQTSYARPTVGFSYLRRVGKHVYVGGKAYWESYSFRYDRVSVTNLFNLFGGGVDSTYATQIRFKASYVFVAPLLDLGVGKHQFFHFYIMPGAGFMVAGSQTTRIYQLAGATTISDNTQITTGSIHEVVFRFNAGMVQHIRVSNDWHITFNESIGAVTALSGLSGTNSISLMPNYYTLQVGLMKKRHYRIISPANGREQIQ